MNRRKALAMAMVATLTAGLLGWVWTQDDLVGTAAPGFDLVRYGDGTLSLAMLSDSVVLVVFWVPSVPECKKALPALQQIYSQLHSQGLEIVGIDMKGKENAAIKFRDRHGITFPLVQGSGKMAVTEWSVEFTPTYFLINRNGVIVRVYRSGDALNMAQVERDIRAQLAS